PIGRHHPNLSTAFRRAWPVEAAHAAVASYPGQQTRSGRGQQRLAASATQNSVQPSVGSQQFGSSAQTSATQGSQPVAHWAGPAVQTSWHWQGWVVVVVEEVVVVVGGRVVVVLEVVDVVVVVGGRVVVVLEVVDGVVEGGGRVVGVHEGRERGECVRGGG